MRSSFEPARDAERAAFEADPLPGFASRFEPEAGAARGDSAPQAAPPLAPELEAVLEARLAAAHAAGEAAGRAALPWQEAERVAAAAGALERAAAALTMLRQDYLRAQRRQLVELALAIAERVLEREVRADPDALVALVERALELVPAGPDLRVRLAAADHATLSAGDRLAALARATGARFEADPTLASGDVQVDAGATGVDATRLALLERVREALAPHAESGAEAAPPAEEAP